MTAAAAGGTITTGSGVFNDTVTLGAGVDLVNTGDGADTVTGALTANDSINLGAGADTYAYQLTTTGNVIDGGAGADTITYSGGAQSFNFSNTTDNIASETGAYQNFENLSATGATGALTVTAAVAGSTLTTGASADTVTLGAGTDVVDTGGGNDIILIGAPGDVIGDTVNGGSGANTIRFTSTATATLTLGAGVTNIQTVVISDAAGVTTGTTAENINAAAVTSALTLTGNAGVNTLTGTGFADTLDGGGGADALNGGGGDDILVFDATDTAIAGGTGNDTLRFTGGQTLNLTGAHPVTAVEVIDLTTGVNTLTLDAAAVIALSETGILRIDGDSSDVVNAGGGWSDGGIVIAGYQRFTQGGATLDVNLNINPTIAGSGQTLTLTNGNDIAPFFTGGPFTDIYNSTSGNLAATDALDGKASRDELHITNAAALVDAQFTGVINIESLILDLDTTQSVTLGTQSERATGVTGIDTVDATALISGTSNVTVNAGARLNATKSLAINTGAGADSITLSAGTDTVNTGDGADTVSRHIERERHAQSGGGGGHLRVSGHHHRQRGGRRRGFRHPHLRGRGEDLHLQYHDRQRRR